MEIKEGISFERIEGKGRTVEESKEILDKLLRKKPEFEKKVEEAKKRVAELEATLDPEKNPPPREWGSKANAWAENYRKTRNALNIANVNRSDASVSLKRLKDQIEVQKRHYDELVDSQVKANKVLWEHHQREYVRKQKAEKLRKFREKAQPIIDTLRMKPESKEDAEKIREIIKEWEGQQDKWVQKFLGVRFPSAEIKAAKKQIVEFQIFKQTP